MEQQSLLPIKNSSTKCPEKASEEEEHKDDDDVVIEDPFKNLSRIQETCRETKLYIQRKNSRDIQRVDSLKDDQDYLKKRSSRDFEKRKSDNTFKPYLKTHQDIKRLSSRELREHRVSGVFTEKIEDLILPSPSNNRRSWKKEELQPLPSPSVRTSRRDLDQLPQPPPPPPRDASFRKSGAYPPLAPPRRIDSKHYFFPTTIQPARPEFEEIPPPPPKSPSHNGPRRTNSKQHQFSPTAASTADSLKPLQSPSHIQKHEESRKNAFVHKGNNPLFDPDSLNTMNSTNFSPLSSPVRTTNIKKTLSQELGHAGIQQPPAPRTLFYRRRSSILIGNGNKSTSVASTTVKKHTAASKVVSFSRRMSFLSRSSSSAPSTVKSRRSILGRYMSTSSSSLGAEMSIYEQAFMPGDLVKRLNQSAGQLPPAPSSFTGDGTVMFVDVTGFTLLSEQLTKDNLAQKASEKLARTITRVLELLAKCCLSHGGEVAKFAGDALLCVWECENASKLAQHCAVNMLQEMESLNHVEKLDLQIHGGICHGSIVHFHFGSADDELRWYLISGSAERKATLLAKDANPGEFLYEDCPVAGRPKPTRKKSLLPGFVSMNQKKVEIQEPIPKHIVERTILQSSSLLSFPLPMPMEGQAVLKDGLPKTCNVYIPRSLRHQLPERSVQPGEIRRRISILFIEVSSLLLSEDELNARAVSDSKLDSLNASFVTMTRIVHSFEGEVRDMLFDDKGCVFIGVFGAHSEEEKEQHPWSNLAVKAAMAVVNEIPMARAGVSCGTCFVGMCGVKEKRTDFVIVGHEVNMAARYMGCAKPGQVLVSSKVHAMTHDSIKYGPEMTVLIGKGAFAKQRSVYSPSEESFSRASFQTFYRRSIKLSEMFVGRKHELELIEQTLNKISCGRSGVISLQSFSCGQGVSSLVNRVKLLGKGKISMVSGKPIAAEKNSSYFVFRQILEAFTGIRSSMSVSECQTIINRIEGGKERLNLIALKQVMPWISKDSKHQLSSSTASLSTPQHVAETIIKILRLVISSSDSFTSVLLVFEDTKWMDGSSLECLNRMVEILEKTSQIGLLLTFHNDIDKDMEIFEQMEDSFFSEDRTYSFKQRVELLKLLQCRVKKIKHNSCWIDLPPLTKEDCSQLAERFFRGEVTQETSERLFQVTKGDAFYLNLLCQWLTENEFKSVDKSGNISIICDNFPSSSVEIINLRLLKFLEQDRKVLQIAASGGSVIDSIYILAVSKALESIENQDTSLNYEQIYEGLANAALEDFVTEIADSSKQRAPEIKQWKFKHDLIYRAIWLEIPLQKRILIEKVASKERQKLALRLKSNSYETAIILN